MASPTCICIPERGNCKENGEQVFSWSSQERERERFLSVWVSMDGEREEREIDVWCSSQINTCDPQLPTNNLWNQAHALPTSLNITHVKNNKNYTTVRAYKNRCPKSRNSLVIRHVYCKSSKKKLFLRLFWYRSRVFRASSTPQELSDIPHIGITKDTERKRRWRKAWCMRQCEGKRRSTFGNEKESVSLRGPTLVEVTDFDFPK